MKKLLSLAALTLAFGSFGCGAAPQPGEDENAPVSFEAETVTNGFCEVKFGKQSGRCTKPNSCLIGTSAACTAGIPGGTLQGANGCGPNVYTYNYVACTF